MKLQTSFFDRATVKKDITRFAPLWVLYTIALMITILPSVAMFSYWEHPVAILNEFPVVFAFSNLLYAGMTAQLLFGELFDSRLCNALHAMPVTRTARFGSHVCTGLAFSFIPNLLVALLMMPSLGQFWFTALFWMAAVCVQYVFFFSIGVLSVMCTGSKTAMRSVYAIINFLPLLVIWFLDMILLPSMPGVVLNDELFFRLCPALRLLECSDYIRVSWNRLDPQVVLAESSFAGLGESWGYVGLLGAVGVGILVLSLLLYQRRKLECTGDFITVRWLKPVFLTLYTLCGCAFFAIFDFSTSFLGQTAMLLLGLLIGFFTGKMLLERTTRVFKKKHFLQGAICAVALLATLGVVKADLFGIVRYVPDVEDVEYIVIDNYGMSETHLTLEDQKQLVHEIHTLAVEKGCNKSCESFHDYFQIEYHLCDGRTVTRAYYICEDSPEAELVDSFKKGK